MTDNSVMSLKPVGVDDIPAQDGILTALADLPEKALLTEAALAKAFRVSDRTIRRMVARHEIPPPVRVGGKSSWFAGRVLAWIEGRAAQEEKEVAQIVAKINAFSN